MKPKGIAIVLATFGLLLVNAPATASSADKPPDADVLRQRIAAQAPDWLKRYDVPSVAVAYVADGKLAWTYVTGEQSPGVPANERTLYNLASLTKPVAAELILRLASAGRLSLDAPMDAHWVDPDLEGQAWTHLLTPRIALSHQTGFKNWRRDSGGMLRFAWQPGTQTGYSGEGYDYVGRYAERALGQPFEVLAQTYVLDPIGMRDSAFTWRPWFEGRLAEPRGPRGETAPKTQSTWTAADLMRATIGDYGKFLASVMHREGLTPAIAAQRDTSTRDLATPDKLKGLCDSAGVRDPARCRGSAGMGLGWEILTLDGDTIIDHSGSDWGVRTFVFYLPDRKQGAVVLTNGENGMKVVREVVEEMIDNPLFLATL